jgi:hypothetical protein
LSCTTKDGQHNKNADDIGRGGVWREGDTYLVLLRVKVVISDDGDVESSTKGLF